MTTAPGNTPTIEKLDLTDLEFQPPCSIVENEQTCGDAAEWAGLFRGHCRPMSIDVLICPKHYGWIISGYLGACGSGHCIILRDYVLRLERIKP